MIQPADHPMMLAVPKAPRGNRASIAVAAPSFEVEAAAIARRLRAQMVSIFNALPRRISGGTDLDRELKLGNTISWRLHSFVSAANPVAALELLPGRSTIERLIGAARKRALPEELLAGLGDAYAEYERFVAEHAGDRATMASLAGGVALGGSAADPKKRKLGFRVNADLWGIQAQTTLLCAALRHDPATGTDDALFLNGYSRVYALRKNAPMRLITRSGAYDTRDTPDAARKPWSPPGDPTILREFSSDPLPGVTTSTDSTGMVETGLRFDNVGKAAAINVFVSQIVRDAYSGAPQPWYGATKGVSIPTEVLVLDLLVSKGRTDPATVRTSTHGHPSAFETLIRRVPEFEFPIRETAQQLGSSLDALDTPDIPRYPEMARAVFARLGWDDSTFDIYRVRVRYPIMHTLVHLRADTAKSPAQGA